MAKLEEIAALLTEEIEGFNVSVAKLEGLSKKLYEVKVKADTSQIEYLLDTHLKRQELFKQSQAKNTSELLHRLNQSKLFPKWLVVFSVILVVLLLILGFSTLHFGHKNKQLKNENSLINEHYRSFIKNSPEIEERYLNWINAN